MMKKYIPLFLSFLLVLVSSCSTTKPFTDTSVIESDLSLSEKLELYGGKKVTVDDPILYFDGFCVDKIALSVYNTYTL